MQRRSHPLLAPVMMVVLAAATAAPGFAQAPPAPPGDTAPFTSPAPPPPAEGGLFPAPDTTRAGVPALPDNTNLRTTGGKGRRARRGNAGAGVGGGRRRQAVNPAFDLAAADPVEVRVAYRRAETEAKRDPIFVELLRRADLAHDDEERRALLRRYYTDLFVRVRKINPSPTIAAHVTVLSRAAEQRYAPRRRAGGPDDRDADRGRAGGLR